MKQHPPAPTGPITITTAANLCEVSRQTASRHVAELGIGTRLGESAKSPIVISPVEFLRLWKKIQKKENSGKFKSGNDLHTLRKHPGRKKHPQPEIGN